MTADLANYSPLIVALRSSDEVRFVNWKRWRNYWLIYIYRIHFFAGEITSTFTESHSLMHKTHKAPVVQNRESAVIVRSLCWLSARNKVSRWYASERRQAHHLFPSIPGASKLPRRRGASMGKNDWGSRAFNSHSCIWKSNCFLSLAVIRHQEKEASVEQVLVPTKDRAHKSPSRNALHFALGIGLHLSDRWRTC